MGAVVVLTILATLVCGGGARGVRDATVHWQ